MLEKNVETHKEFLNRDPLFKAGFLYASIIVSIVWIVAFAFWTRTLNKQEKIVDIKAKDIKANKIEFNNTLAIHPEWSRGYK